MTTLILSIPSPARFVVAALSVGPLLFSSPDYAQIKTPPTNDAAVIAAAPGGQAAEDRSIHPFKVHVPQAALDDLRRRVAATRWPDKETVADRSQGAQLARLQALVQYCGAWITTGARRKRS
jgi:hypothetical protein